MSPQEQARAVLHRERLEGNDICRRRAPAAGADRTDCMNSLYIIISFPAVLSVVATFPSFPKQFFATLYVGRKVTKKHSFIVRIRSFFYYFFFNSSILSSRRTWLFCFLWWLQPIICLHLPPTLCVLLSSFTQTSCPPLTTSGNLPLAFPERRLQTSASFYSSTPPPLYTSKPPQSHPNGLHLQNLRHPHEGPQS